MCDASCDTIYNQSQPHCINKQGYHQDFHPEVRVPNAFILSENFAHIGFMLGDKPRLFGTVICQHRIPTFYRTVYELSKLGKLLRSAGCLKVRVPFCFYYSIAMQLTILSQLPTAALSSPSMWLSAAIAFSKSSLNFISVSFASLISTRSLSTSDFSVSICWLISTFSSMSLTFMGDVPLDFPIPMFLYL